MDSATADSVFVAVHRGLVDQLGEPMSCDSRERLWTQAGWFALLRTTAPGPASGGTAQPRVVELRAAHINAAQSAECSSTAIARLDSLARSQVPRAGARLVPLDARITALEHEVAGCDAIRQWKPDTRIRFDPPRVFRLDTVVVDHTAYNRTLRVEPRGRFIASFWSVALPNRIRIDWLDGTGEMRSGGVYADLLVSGDTLVGAAWRYTHDLPGAVGSVLRVERAPCSG